MRRIILTGAPGAGKTALLRRLELDGFAVVEEAATDVIALAQARGVPEPWTEAGFIEAVLDLQRRREVRAQGDVVLFDRSPVCTLALARWLGRPIPDALAAELDRLRRDEVYGHEVAIVQGLGFMAHTAARRITLEDARRFEATHVTAYREHGFTLVAIPPGPLEDRAAETRRALRF